LHIEKRKERSMSTPAAKPCPSVSSKTDWRVDYLAEFKALACADEYPCIYVKQAFEKDHLSFHFVDDAHCPTDREQAFEAFRSYVADVLATPEERTAAMKILLIVINSESLAESHEALAWELLNDFTRRDDIAWPAHLPRDPDEADWAYCFQGQRIFVNISSPEHQLRRSRNLGRHLVLVLQLRDGIDCIAPPDSKGDVIRNFIRKRIDAYDAVPVSPDLATHGQGENRDWKQFWLGDRETVMQGKCPFHAPSGN
jgi:FPC/CPF motif-containing protein YcgG